MKLLILTDIHANYPALQAVLKDAGSWDKILFLGDLANFGPNPSECIQLLKKEAAICIMGNHDSQIISDDPKHFWDKWVKERISQEELQWLATFKEMEIIDSHILLVHGIYDVEYDILPNTPDTDIKNAFKNYLSPEIDEVWFGHYHYELNRKIDGVMYRCIRPVGHHRDHDTRASYYIYENGEMIQKRVSYDVEKVVCDLRTVDCFPSEILKEQFIELVQNAYQKDLLEKDILAMENNEIKILNANTIGERL